jgi:hypothetical protein
MIMRKQFIYYVVSAVILINVCAGYPVWGGTLASPQTLRLHPLNPHYMEYKGKPILLITSGEHYGSVINPAFDYIKYLNTLQKDSMNYTRIFSGSMYWENDGDFAISNNTLAPDRGTALCPWKRSEVAGNVNGGNKFDLDQWDENYFNRLKSFVGEAQKRNIMVEVTLFTSIYSDNTWSNCPVNPQNNINNLTISNFKKVNTMENGNLLQYQDKFIKKIVTELNSYDNVLYEIVNEPWSDQGVRRYRPNVWQKSSLEIWQTCANIAADISLEWQSHISRLIADTEKTLNKTHLIAQNYSSEAYPAESVDPTISILNFHYAWAEAVTFNYGWNRVIGFDESGFAGSDDDTYRRQAWVFLMSGGGLFDNLDYSFAVGHEDGTLTQKAPGGGSPALRKQLSILQKFFSTFDFIHFSPDKDVVVLSPGAYDYALSNRKDQFMIYLNGSSKMLRVNIPAGKYQVKYMNPTDGTILEVKTVDAQAPFTTLSIPAYSLDMAVSLTKNTGVANPKINK